VSNPGLGDAGIGGRTGGAGQPGRAGRARRRQPRRLGEPVWGTVYTPNAALVDHSTANIEGNVVVRTLQHGGSAVGAPGADGGEIHDTPFRSTVTP